MARVTATAAKQEEAAAWDEWTNAAKEELVQKETKEDSQAKKIDNLFSEMAPKSPTKVSKKKGGPRVPMQAMAAPTSRGGRVEAGSRLSMGAANFDLGDLSDDEEDAWGGDDLDMGYDGPLGGIGYCHQGTTYAGSPNEICGGEMNWGATQLEVWRPACTACGGHGACDAITRVCACEAGYALANPATCVRVVRA